MKGQSFCRDTASIEAALRLALSHMATASGKDHRLLAAALDMSPSQFSRAISAFPSEESHQRANFPPDKLALYHAESGDYSFVMTLLDWLGFDPSRLAEIRKPTKSQAQLLEEIADRLVARDKEDQQIREQLKLVMQEPDGREKKKVKK